MGRIKGYKDLIAWQKGMDLVEAVYRLSAVFPVEEKYGLTSQVRRAAVGIPSNVAEGYSRPTQADYIRFLDMARGSANEVETQLLIAIRLGYVRGEQASIALGLANEEQRILKGLADRVSQSDKKSFRTT